MNAGDPVKQNTTPPKSKTARELFLEQVRASHRHENRAREIYKTYEDKMGTPAQAVIMVSDDFDYRAAIGEQQFAERKANMYANVYIVNLLESILGELQLLRNSSSGSPSTSTATASRQSSTQ